HPALVLVEHAALIAQRYDVAKLILAVVDSLGGKGLEPEHPQKVTAGIVQEADKRPENSVKDFEWACDGERDGLGFSKGDGLGGYLAQYNCEEGYQGKCYNPCQRVS